MPSKQGGGQGDKRETVKGQVEREVRGVDKGTEKGPALPLTRCHGPRQAWADDLAGPGPCPRP